MQYAKLLLERFGIRKTKQQKEEFRRWLMVELKQLGYFAYEESGSSGAVNVVAGEPEKVKLLLTAHYDTAVALPFPTFYTPYHPWLYFLYQGLMIFLAMALCFVLAFAAGFALGQPGLVMPLTLVLMVALLVYFAAGPAAKHTANANTSGVALLLEIAKAMPAPLKKKVAFVFFDMGQGSLTGANGYKRKHLKELDKQMLVNFDCVGDGDTAVLLPSKKAKWDGELLDAINVAFSGEAGKYQLRLQGWGMHPSDNRKFKRSVAVLTANFRKAIGPCITGVCGNKDTVLKEENLRYLCESTIKMIEIYTEE